jgi:hypothetical protein
MPRGSTRRVATALALAAGITFSGSALSQKPGGILRIYHRDTPASMSILEEATISAEMPMMGVFNNLVEFDQHTPQNSVTDIVPDLATSWSWNADATELTFRLRETVKWHDGVPLTSKDVKCTLDLLTEKSTDRLRINPRKTWYQNIADVTTNGDYEVVFHLKRPQPSLLVLLSSGYSPIPRDHVAGHQRVEPRPHVAALRDRLDVLDRVAWAGHRKQYGPRHAAYDLKKLRGKQIVDRIRHTRRYETLPTGLRALTALLVLRNKAIKPLLAAAQPLRPTRGAHNPHPIDAHYQTINLAMQGRLP